MNEIKPNTIVDIGTLHAAGYTLHHSASRKGYCRVGERGMVEPYKGRFGEGWIRKTGKHRGSNQYIDIDYYIKPKEM